MREKSARINLLLALLFLCLGFASARAQTATAVYQVFVTHGALDRLTFIDVLSGAQTTFDLNGDRYTLTDSGVLFFDQSDRRVRIAQPNGVLRDHPFMQPDADARRIDWIVSGTWIAWTLTYGDYPALTTRSWVASGAGLDRRELLADDTGEGVRAFPVALDTNFLYLDYQPDSIGDITPFRQYAGLFSVDLVTGAALPLPGEPGCFCGAGIGAGRFIRLTLAADFNGFDVRVIDLATGAQQTLPSVGAFTQGGDVLIAPDGRAAAYALGEIVDFGTSAQRLRTSIVLIDLTTMTQRILIPATDRGLHPMQFTDGWLILYNSESDTTLKVDLSDGTLDTVAQAQYLGTVQNS